MKKIVIMLGIISCFLCGCSSSKDMQTDEKLNLIQMTEDEFVNIGMFADKHKDAVYEYLRTKDESLLVGFCSEKAKGVLKGIDLGNFVIVKQNYMTAIGRANITHYMMIRSGSELSVMCLYWSSTELYDVDWGKVKNSDTLIF